MQELTFYYHLISEKLVATVVNGSERVGGDHLSLSTIWDGGFWATRKQPVIVLHHIMMV